ncbi:TPA: hypothetical protein REQ84_001163 [Listeria monocytogenes]|nr:hypothetical protein [Listeria monocytogenes]HDU0945384.1 hypothetical protein [Listeria monocytogenes]
MNFKVGDKVTWIKDKNVIGKVVSINDFRPPEMECAVAETQIARCASTGTALMMSC